MSITMNLNNIANNNSIDSSKMIEEYKSLCKEYQNQVDMQHLAFGIQLTGKSNITNYLMWCKVENSLYIKNINTVSNNNLTSRPITLKNNLTIFKAIEAAYNNNNNKNKKESVTSISLLPVKIPNVLVANGNFAKSEESNSKIDASKEKADLERQRNLGADSVQKGIANGASKSMFESVLTNFNMDPVLLRIREAFNKSKKSLRESDFDGDSNYRKAVDVKSFVKNSSITKWEDTDFEEVLEAAKEGNISAKEYLFYISENVINSVFWKNFLGPNKSMQAKRIHEGAAYEFASIAWITLSEGYTEGTKLNGKAKTQLGVLDALDTSKIKSDLRSAFLNMYKIKLRSACMEYNWASKRQGMNADIVDDESISYSDIDQYGGDREVMPDSLKYTDESFLDSPFMDKWSEYVQDEELQHEKRGFSKAKALAIILQNPGETNLRSLGAKYDVNRNTFNTYLNSAIDIMEEYGISPKDFQKAINDIGADKLASYL